ncbi:DMT family transporter [Alteromonas sp. ASW11-36]|uniref:DMT family transporter n=1 Tax=Alteromonas arenosi TaxID=3055817 RepID=A0ABT7SYD5_9ALTE|nr:DMT family transporter [Alteromonas sp. ASW11-36]MDM7861204.1 DMT family transporter [Alteromonas sp. ASW11-36]
MSTASPTTPSPSIWLGAVCLIAAELCFAGVGAVVKALSEQMNQTQLVFFRNASALVVLIPIVFRSGLGNAVAVVRTERLKLHLFRAVCGMVAMYGFFYVLATLTLTQAMMALMLAPFIVPIIAFLWLKERIDSKTAIAIGVGFCGAAVILLTKPSQAQPLNIMALAIAIGCAVLVATTKCTIRKLTDSEPSLRIVFYFTGVATVISLVPMLIYWQPLLRHVIPWLIVMGVLAAIGQLLMTRAFALASPVKIGLLSYSSLIFAAIIGAIGWQEPITLSLILGSVLVIWAANLTIRQRWLW